MVTVFDRTPEALVTTNWYVKMDELRPGMMALVCPGLARGNPPPGMSAKGRGPAEVTLVVEFATYRIDRDGRS